MKNVSAIIVTYNRLKLLKICLSHLLNQSYKLNKIFIINNNSTDGTTKYLKDLNDSHIIDVNLTKNMGGAGGFSIGTKMAYENSDSDYFWLMDDDSMPECNALSSLIKSANKLDNNFGFLCSNVRWSRDNTPCLTNVPKVSDDWTDLLNIGLVKLRSATFVSLLVKRSVVTNLGLPILDMFIWGDDTEYTTRISRSYRSYLVSDSIVFHNSLENINNISIFNMPINRAYYYKYAVRNLLFINRKFTNYRKVVKLLLSDISVLIRIPFDSKDHKILRFSYIFMGILKGLFFDPSVKFPK